VEPDHQLRPLAGPLRDLVNWLDKRGDPYAIIGGVAACLQSKVRATADIDVVISTDETKLDALVADAKAHGFTPRRADPVGFAAVNRIVLLTHLGDEINVDMSLADLAFERELIAKAKRIAALGVRVPLARPEELIAMKVLAFRNRDVRDIESLLDAHPRINLKQVTRWVTLLAVAAEQPEILDRLESVLRARRRTAPSRRPRRRKQ